VKDALAEVCTPRSEQSCARAASFGGGSDTGTRGGATGTVAVTGEPPVKRGLGRLLGSGDCSNAAPANTGLLGVACVASGAGVGESALVPLFFGGLAFGAADLGCTAGAGLDALPPFCIFCCGALLLDAPTSAPALGWEAALATSAEEGGGGMASDFFFARRERLPFSLASVGETGPDVCRSITGASSAKNG